MSERAGVSANGDSDHRLVGRSFALSHIPHPDKETVPWCGSVATSWNRVDVDVSDVETCPDCLDRQLKRKAGRSPERVEA